MNKTSEPSQNFGSEMKENFARFLKILIKIVPHIVIITSNSDEKYDGARYFTVVKEHGYSRLVKDDEKNSSKKMLPLLRKTYEN